MSKLRKKLSALTSSGVKAPDFALTDANHNDDLSTVGEQISMSLPPEAGQNRQLRARACA